jgi:hypothetical protein
MTDICLYLGSLMQFQAGTKEAQNKVTLVKLSTIRQPLKTPKGKRSAYNQTCLLLKYWNVWGS